jgi:hypothetical protein
MEWRREDSGGLPRLSAGQARPLRPRPSVHADLAQPPRHRSCGTPQLVANPAYGTFGLKCQLFTFLGLFIGTTFASAP